MRHKVILYLFSILILTSLFYTQIINRKKYSEIALKNVLMGEKIIATRGIIYDRNGIPLAVSYPSYNLYIYPAHFKEKDMEKIKEILKNESILKKFKKGYRVVKIENIDYEKASFILEHIEEFNGVSVKIEPKRYYLYDELLSHLIGYVGEVSDDEIKKNYNLNLGDIIGKKGIEKSYDNFLRGKDGIEYVITDAHGRKIGKTKNLNDVKPVEGYEISLTIDLELTKFVDSLMQQYSKGAVCAMNPKNGEIIVYYSKPGFPSNKIVYESADSIWNELLKSPDYPLFDRVLQGQYPPGSVFKVFTALCGLKNGLVSPETRFSPCYGGIYIGNKYMGCWNVHGSLNLKYAIIRSCDVYFYQLGLKIGLKRLSEEAKEFGFGTKTGIDIPDEKSGLIPDENWYNRFFGRYGWGKGVVANLAIGQGEILVTPLQVVRFIGGIFNGGYFYKPYLVKEIKDKEGNIVYKPKIEFKKIDIDTGIVNFLRYALKGVIDDSTGTAHWVKIKDIDIGGKTGTAQNPHGEDHSLFVSFAPVEEPEIVVFVVVENAGHGSTVAAPIAVKLIQRYLKGRNNVKT
uniref:Penicillin-binding protein 2 n=1 Tax=candidate division WOR-3 bacterium TaxID=2052148 RepID=A0A7C4UGY0_UNCW3